MSMCVYIYICWSIVGLTRRSHYIIWINIAAFLLVSFGLVQPSETSGLTLHLLTTLTGVPYLWTTKLHEGYMVISWNRATPSSHPIYRWIFPNQNHPAMGVPPWPWKAPYRLWARTSWCSKTLDPTYTPCGPWLWKSRKSTTTGGACCVQFRTLTEFA